MTIRGWSLLCCLALPSSTIPSPVTMIGAAIVVGSTLIITWHEQWEAKKAKVEAAALEV